MKRKPKKNGGQTLAPVPNRAAVERLARSEARVKNLERAVMNSTGFMYGARGASPRVTAPSTPNARNARIPRPAPRNTSRNTVSPTNGYRAESRDKYMWYLRKYENDQQRVANHIKKYANGLTGNARKKATNNAATTQRLASRTKQQRDMLKGVWRSWPITVGANNKLRYAPNVRRTINDIARRYANTGYVKKPTANRPNTRAMNNAAAFRNAFNAPPTASWPSRTKPVKRPVAIRNLGRFAA